jgi:chromosome segregation ATPase
VSEKYTAGPFKCRLEDCHDTEPHQHAPASLHDHIAALRSENTALRRRVEEQSRELDDLRKGVGLPRQVEELQAKLAEAEKEYENTEQHRVIYRDRALFYEKKMQEAESRESALREEVEKWKGKAVEMKDKYVALSSQVSALREALSAYWAVRDHMAECKSCYDGWPSTKGQGGAR